MSKQEEKSQKEIEKEKKRQEKIDRQRAELVAYIKSLPAFNQWLKYSTEMGSFRNRMDYLKTEKGKKELQKRFGQALDKTPKNWDQVELDLEKKDISWLKIFIKMLDAVARSWGV